MQPDDDGDVDCSDLPLTGFLQLHIQHVQIMMLCHDVIFYLLVSMLESYF